MLQGCTDGTNPLPSYMPHVDSSGAVRIDIEKASDGLATLDEGNKIILKSDYSVFQFTMVAFSVPEGPSSMSIEEPPISMSRILTPGDGVADFFATVWMNDEGNELRYDLFLDTDWQQVFGSDISIHIKETIDRSLTYERVQVDFSMASDGVYHKEITFTGSDNFPENSGPGVRITNIPGDSNSFLMRYMRFEDWQPEHVVVEFGFSRRCFSLGC